MSERWASFDCYGTLIDWMGGIGATLARLWPAEDAARLLERYHEIAAAPQWRELRAVREGNVYAVDATSYYSRPGPRLVEGTRILARIFHRGRVTAPLAPDVAFRLADGGFEPFA